MNGCCFLGEALGLDGSPGETVIFRALHGERVDSVNDPRYIEISRFTGDFDRGYLLDDLAEIVTASRQEDPS